MSETISSDGFELFDPGDTLPPASDNKPEVATNAEIPVVDLHTAEVNMQKRAHGVLPPISASASDSNPVTGSGEVPDQPSDDAGVPIRQLAEQLGQLLAPAVQSFLPDHGDPFINPGPYTPPDERVGYRDRTPDAPPGNPSSCETYLAERTRVSFKVSGGTYSVPAVDVNCSGDSIVILLPMDDKSATFIPELGSEVVISVTNGRTYDCYFPGVHAALDALGVTVLGFIRKDSEV